MPIVAARLILPDLEFGGVDEAKLDEVVMMVPGPQMAVSSEIRSQANINKCVLMQASGG